MEKIRIFERKCLRVCLNKYRKPETNYKHYISNKTIYNESKIIRIDNFLIHLIRKHYARSAENDSNSNIIHPIFTEDKYIKEILNTEFLPPESFIYLDKMNYIQNNNIPIFYHISRRATKKAISNNSINDIINKTNLKYNMDISDKDKNKNINELELFFWLNDNNI